MEGQSKGSVRRNIALKLKDTSSHKVPEPRQRKERETEDVGSDGEPSGTGSRVQTGVRKSHGHTTDELKWDHKVNLIGRPVKDPLLHICETCSLPILIYGRMKRCRHAFCRDCAKKAGGICPKCKEGDQQFEEASMGSVYVCNHGGGRYDNKGCGRSYLSQRDLEAHIAYRHKDKSQQIAVPTVPMQSSSVAPPLPPFPLPPFFQTTPSGMPANFAPPSLPASLPPGSIPPPPPPSIPIVSVPLLFGGQVNPSLSTATPWSRPPGVFK